MQGIYVGYIVILSLKASAFSDSVNGNNFLKDRESVVAYGKFHVEITEKPLFESYLSNKLLQKVVNGVGGTVSPDFMLVGSRCLVGDYVVHLAVNVLEILYGVFHFLNGGKLLLKPCSCVHKLTDVLADASAESKDKLSVNTGKFGIYYGKTRQKQV